MNGLFRSAAPWLIETDDEPRPPAREGTLVSLTRLGTRTGVLLAAFTVLQWFVLRFCRLPEEGPGAESILLECVRSRALIVIPAASAFGVLLFVVPRLRQGWNQFEGGAPLRWFVGALAAMLAWAGSAYSYNSWFDRPHDFDRGMLVLLAVLVFWRPVFVLPFVASFWAVVWQFSAPALGFQSLQAEFKPVVNTLTLFCSAFFIRALFGGRTMHGFLFLTVCLVAANFAEPGLAKLRMGWFTHGHVYLLFPNAYTHGWLAFLEPRTITSITGALALFDWPMRIGTLTIELGALLLFVNMRTAKVWFGLFTVLLGVFFLTLGYLFWKWMLLQVALWALLFRTSGPAAEAWRRALFTRQRFAVSLVVIGFARFWFVPAPLAWFDTPLVNTLRYEAVGRGGRVYDLLPDFFAPYDSHIAMANFVGPLTPAPVLAASYGVSYDRASADALLVARDPDDVIRIENAAVRREIPVDEVVARQFDEFVRRTATVSNRNIDGGRSGDRWHSPFRPPAFIWTFPRGTPYRRNEPIAAVRVYRVSSFFDGRTYTVFRRDPLRTIHIEP